MSYDVRNYNTGTSKRLAELERVNYLTLKSKLNKDYEDAQTERVENERLQIEPAIPVYQTRDQLLQSMTSQRQILKLNLAQIMKEDEIKNFIGITFKNPEYAILTNQYWDELEPLLKPLAPMTSSYLFEYLNRFFYTKQKLGEEIDVLVDPAEYGDMTDVNMRTAFMTSQPFNDEEVKIAVREIANRNYNMNFDIYSPARDAELISFYVREKIIPATTKPTMEHWRAIFDKEIRGFDERVGSYLPFTAFTFEKYKEGSPLAYGQPSPPGVPTPPATMPPRPVPSTRTAPVPGVGGTPSAPAAATRGRARVAFVAPPAQPAPVPLGGLPPSPPPPPPPPAGVRIRRRGQPRVQRVVQPGGQPVVNPAQPPSAAPGAPSVAAMVYQPPVQPEAPSTPPPRTSPRTSPRTPPRTAKREAPTISPEPQRKRLQRSLPLDVQEEVLDMIRTNNNYNDFSVEFNRAFRRRQETTTLRILWTGLPDSLKQPVVAQLGEPQEKEEYFNALKYELEESKDEGFGLSKRQMAHSRFGKYRLSTRALQKKS